MNNPLNKKLRSSRGASLSAALLLFMVCAVLGSVVLKTATAASGRLVGLAQSDQEYYAVTSVADYLTDVITNVTDADGTKTPRTVTLTRTGTEVKRTTYTTRPDGTMATSTAKQSSEYKLNSVVDNSGGSGATILTYAVNDLFFDGKIVSDLNIDQFNKKNPDSAGKTITFPLEIKGPDYENKMITVISANCTETLKSNGDLVLTVSCPGTNYMIRLVFTLQATTKDTNKTTVADPVSTTNPTTSITTVTQDTTEVITRVTTLKWTLAEVSKVSSVSTN